MFTPNVTTLPLLGHKTLRFGVLEAYLKFKWPVFFSITELHMLLGSTQEQFSLPTEQDKQRLVEIVRNDPGIAVNQTGFRDRVLVRNIDCVGVVFSGNPATGISLEYGVFKTPRPVTNLHEALELMRHWTINHRLDERMAYAMFRELVSQGLMPCPADELARLLARSQVNHTVDRVASTVRTVTNFFDGLFGV